VIAFELKHEDVIRALAAYALDKSDMVTAKASVVLYVDAARQITATVKLTPK